MLKNILLQKSQIQTTILLKNLLNFLSPFSERILQNLLKVASESELQNSHFLLEVTSETVLQKFRMQRTCFPFASFAVGVDVFYFEKMERYL